jgi:4'-phosphopantetheinyl transferase
MNRCHPIDRETARLLAPSGDGPLALWTHVLADADADVPGDWLADLCAEEIAYCRRLRRAADRLSYAAAHALLRRALGQGLGVAPATLQFARDARGRPRLAAPAERTVDFNLSHTDGLVAVAISRVGRVGVDVECVEHIGGDRAALGALYADSTLHELRAFGLRDDEIAELAALPEALREAHFLDGWTLREAVAKADGRGLSLPLSLISVDREGQVATLANTANGAPQRWRLWRVAPTPHHRLALACANEDATLLAGTSLL